MKDDKNRREGQTGAAAGGPEKNPARNSAKNSTENSAQNSATNSRQDRLKLALRENLKRRKSQARGRGDATVAPSAGDDVAPHDECEEEPRES
jgi:hypothetical protein